MRYSSTVIINQIYYLKSSKWFVRFKTPSDVLSFDLHTTFQQTNEQTPTTSKHTLEFAYTDNLFHLKLNRGLIADGSG